LVGPLVVVVLYPQPYPLAGGLEAVKLCSHQKLLPNRLPEPFDLPQSHGMMGPAFDVMDPILRNSASKRVVPRQLEYWRPVKGGVKLDHRGGGKLDQMSV